MLTRSTLISLVLVAVVPLGVAKNKQVLPDYVLQAQTVAVVVMPDAGESVTAPAANRTAEQNVEKALLQWGRYRLVPDALTADLIVAVRKGEGKTDKAKLSDPQTQQRRTREGAAQTVSPIVLDGR